MLNSLEGEVFESAIRLTFTITNNEVDYEVVIVDMKIAREMEAKSLEIKSDSQIVAGHIGREYEA